MEKDEKSDGNAKCKMQRRYKVAKGRGGGGDF